MSKRPYKGLGATNTSQLRETTTDPNVRRLLKVQMEDATAVDQIFATSMGEGAEPCRTLSSRMR